MHEVTQSLVTDAAVIAAHRSTLSRTVDGDPSPYIAALVADYQRTGWSLATPADANPVILRQWAHDLPIARVTITASPVTA